MCTSLKETVAQLEEQTEALEAAVSVEHARASERDRSRRRSMRRARSVPGRDPATSAAAAAEFRGLPSSSSSQAAGRDVALVAGLQLRLEVERGRRRRAEDDLAAVVAENCELGAQLREAMSNAARRFPDRTETGSDTPLDAAANTAQLDKTRIETNTSLGPVCSECRKPVSVRQPFSEPYEHDLEELPSGPGKLVRLKNGGSAFGSRDSLYRIGLEPDDATPGREVCSAILAASFQSAQTVEGATSAVEETKPSDSAGGGSLLAELEEQYRRLVLRYESLIEAKTSNTDAPKSDPDPGASRPRDLNLPSSDPTEGHFDRGPPEYKRLFSEIFKTLRRSAEYPPLTSPQPKGD